MSSRLNGLRLLLRPSRISRVLSLAHLGSGAAESLCGRPVLRHSRTPRRARRRRRDPPRSRRTAAGRAARLLPGRLRHTRSCPLACHVGRSGSERQCGSGAACAAAVRDVRLTGLAGPGPCRLHSAARAATDDAGNPPEPLGLRPGGCRVRRDAPDLQHRSDEADRLRPRLESTCTASQLLPIITDGGAILFPLTYVLGDILAEGVRAAPREPGDHHRLRAGGAHVVDLPRWWISQPRLRLRLAQPGRMARRPGLRPSDRGGEPAGLPRRAAAERASSWFEDQGALGRPTTCGCGCSASTVVGEFADTLRSSA